VTFSFTPVMVLSSCFRGEFRTSSSEPVLGWCSLTRILKFVIDLVTCRQAQELGFATAGRSRDLESHLLRFRGISIEGLEREGGTGRESTSSGEFRDVGGWDFLVVGIVESCSQRLDPGHRGNRHSSSVGKAVTVRILKRHTFVEKRKPEPG